MRQLNYYPFDTFLKWKIMYFMTRIEKKMGFLSPPRYLQLEVTTKCNLKCLMCERNFYPHEYLNQDLIFKDFKTIINQFTNLATIELTGFGEPFFNKDFMTMLRFVKHRRMVVSFTSHFNLLPKEVSKELVKIGVDFINISIDGASKKTYEAIRIGGKFDLLINNIKNIQKIKNKSGFKKPYLKINTVISNLNAYEIPSIMKLAKYLGIYEIKLTPVIRFNQIKEVLKNAKIDRFNEDSKVHNLVYINSTKEPVSKCIFPWLGPYISIKGYVFPCCYSKANIDRSERPRVALGNIFKQNIKTIWRSERFNEIRQCIQNGSMPDLCKGCPLYV